LLEKLNIYGWNNRDENLLLASILTGDPILLIGDAGCAKTATIGNLARALGLNFVAYDASKSLFEDVLGFPNPASLKNGKMEYIESPITIWDKQYVLIDELNRSAREMQSKWLEIIRSRQIMGMPTKVTWIAAAMNPMTYSATNSLDEALIERFAIFVYPPDILSMDDKYVCSISRNVSRDDAPALSGWGHKTTEAARVIERDEEFDLVIREAARFYSGIYNETAHLPEFLARFAKTLNKETKDKLKLNGRRIGFISRAIIATRAIELAKNKILGSPLRSLTDSVLHTIKSSIPLGLSDTAASKADIEHSIETTFRLLEGYFSNKYDIKLLDVIYELFTTKDLLRKAKILFTEPIGEFAKAKAWKDVIESGDNVSKSLIAYVALTIEACKPGTLPREFIKQMTDIINFELLTKISIKNIDESVYDFRSDILALFNEKNLLKKAILVVKFNEKNKVMTVASLSETKNNIESEVEKLYREFADASKQNLTEAV
jgi:hypothetical protein